MYTAKIVERVNDRAAAGQDRGAETVARPWIGRKVASVSDTRIARPCPPGGNDTAGERSMLISNGQYLKPSKSTRVLAILDSLAHNSGLSQFEMGRRLRLSGAMINQYLKQLQEEGLVQFLPVNGKSFRYILTPEGERHRRHMFTDYSSETIQLYTSVKNFILDKLTPLRAKGQTRMALFGASETCEVVLSALRESDFLIAAIVDNDTAKHGQIFHGHVISSPLVLEQLPVRAVVITSFGKQDEIYAQLEPLSRRKGFEIMRL